MRFDGLLSAALAGQRVKSGAGQSLGRLATLEWTCTSPPPHDNFNTTPTVGDPYDSSNIVYDETIGGYVRDNRLAAPYSTTTPIAGNMGMMHTRNF